MHWKENVEKILKGHLLRLDHDRRSTIDDRPRTKSQHSAISSNRALNGTPACIPSLWTLKRRLIAWIETHYGSCWPTMASRRRSLNWSGWPLNHQHAKWSTTALWPNPSPSQLEFDKGACYHLFFFLIVIDWIMRETTKDRKRGLQWSMMEQLEDIDYADDIALISQRHIDMKEKLLKLDEEARKTGLKINVKKTKSLRLNHTIEATFTIRQDNIEEVQDFSYLGSTVSTEGGTDQDIRIRIGKAAGVFNTLRPIWQSTKLSLNTKLRIYNSNVKSVLLYGCETWRVLKSSMAKIQVFVNRCLRRILGVRWYDKLRNEELWRITAQEPIEQQIKRSKWRWLGHTLRKPADNVTRRGLRWTPQGKRKRGRPKTTWRRSIEAEAKVAGLTWGQLEQKAQDRGGWRTLVDDLCSVRNDRN